MALTCLSLLALAVTFAVGADGPPPYEPPAGYLPPEVDVRIVGLMPGQLVALGSTHDLRVEALDEAGAEWGDRYDWYIDSVHVAMGPEFSWTVSGPKGDQRVTLVVSSGDASAWAHVDVIVDREGSEPPAWLSPTIRVVPLVAIAFWLTLVYRQVTRRQARGPPDGSG
jgi:hypothetical protein